MSTATVIDFTQVKAQKAATSVKKVSGNTVSKLKKLAGRNADAFAEAMRLGWSNPFIKGLRLGILFIYLMAFGPAVAVKLLVWWAVLDLVLYKIFK